MSLKTELVKYLIKPNFSNPDRARREFILNTLLLGLIVITIPAVVINIIKIYTVHDYHGSNPLMTGGILVFWVFLLWLSRKGYSFLVSNIFVVLLFLINLYVGFHWGPDLPQSLLLYSLIIVMTSILLDSRKAIFISLFSGGAILVLARLKITGLIQTEDRWRYEVIHFADAIVYAITLGIIALVSWLFNREMERALRRARVSEAALRRQRDSLEVTVEKRTKELKQAQAEKLAQLYRFAEFGKSASGLFHDLVNPLTLVSLNLNKLSRDIKQPVSDATVALSKAIAGTKHLENFIQAARRQIQSQAIVQRFSLIDETNQAIRMFEYKAKEAHVKIYSVFKEDIRITGSPIKFNQLITNLVSNSVDAYDKSRKKKKEVEIRTFRVDSIVKVEIQDWGNGIKPKDLPQIFDPLFTTKSFEKGTGIGLSICKDIVEKDFGGRILVDSQFGLGTTFIVEFPIRRTHGRK